MVRRKFDSVPKTERLIENGLEEGEDLKKENFHFLLMKF